MPAMFLNDGSWAQISQTEYNAQKLTEIRYVVGNKSILSWIPNVGLLW